ncbi:hypothetical protein LBMAG42_41180 [Deltaproteobacteria bacterium]|nr:hypothetical protein LBMAG42_41180 [Deltaproteobacteria bacterium]
MTALLITLLACDPAAPDELAPLTGVITSNGESAELVGGAGFAAERDGRIVVVVYPRSEVTCELAGQDMGAGGEDWDASVVQEAGKCSMSILADYDDGLDITGGTLFDATVSVSCAMGDGTWEYREEDRYNSAGYFYTGSWWQGSPEAFDLTVSGDEEAGYTFEVTMETYTGQYIYDLEEADPDPAEGAVSGGMVLEPCGDISTIL